MTNQMLSFINILSFVGLVTLLTCAYRTFNWVLLYTRPSRLRRFAHPSPNGEECWALVTGASDGIGKAFAHELAANGFNVVLHGRNDAKLHRVVSELQATFPRRSFRVLVADASNVADTVHLATGSGSAKFEFLEHLYVTALINNVGGSVLSPDYPPLSATPESSIASNVSLNALFPLHLTRVLLPRLAQNQPSLVLNMSTQASTGQPLNCCYAASKAFLISLTRGLRLEMFMEGVDVEILGIQCGRVTGAAGFTDAPSLFVPSAIRMARAALARTGYNAGVVTGYIGHSLQLMPLTILPAWVVDQLFMNIMRRVSEGRFGGGQSRKSR
ncbi:hypothetical protein PFICI_03175 [Pestalotiopsis fici W106-1]|uniref:Uncharacterized protein n=1 Tax=Pestalotiopsis fici (strain W106-1 / CGMCC3.15140) TaxID=1229662 RepID=W3XGJ3_PESFW|nr:uncharacterized protein PFICI_03175 [Pestalotiopsis fici W106-1]ETS85150.1 hypothetical protein PFICI_03175 [Pestalotiopsis fici W106-1]